MLKKLASRAVAEFVQIDGISGQEKIQQNFIYPSKIMKSQG